MIGRKVRAETTTAATRSRRRFILPIRRDSDHQRSGDRDHHDQTGGEHRRAGGGSRFPAASRLNPQPPPVRGSGPGSERSPMMPAPRPSIIWMVAAKIQANRSGRPG